MTADYEKACKAGRKEGGTLPNLDTVLDDLGIKAPREVSLGLCSVPLELVVGTKSAARAVSFSRNFNPVLDENTEFAFKWDALCAAQLDEGIRDPIKAYEFMNKYYVEEGNKRVSVLKYFGAASVQAEVTRIIPPWTGTKECLVYYEYMEFYELSKVNFIYFSKPGDFAKLQALAGKRPDEKWSEDDRKELRSLYAKIKSEYDAAKTGKTEVSPADILLFMINLFGYEALLSMSSMELRELFRKSREEFLLLKEANPTTLKTDPAESAAKAPLIKRLIPASAPVEKVGFIYEGNPSSSGWTYAHELGRMYLAGKFEGEIETLAYENTTTENVGEVIGSAIADGCDMIFTASSLFFKESLKAAIRNPKVNILNCSLNVSHRLMRTYYARIYESKFLTGAIAGAMSEDGRIGYLADCPLYGTAANINAFALGAKLVNPRAKIYLAWQCIENFDENAFFDENDLKYVSGSDVRSASGTDLHRGLYQNDPARPWNLAMPVTNWGHFYEKIIRMVMDGSFEYDDAKDASKALNYWWGMSAGVADVICSPHLPIGTLRLIDLLKETIASGDFNPFSGPLYSQKGLVRSEGDPKMTPGEIISMDWLAENVVGSFPEFDALKSVAKKRVALQNSNYLE